MVYHIMTANLGAANRTRRTVCAAARSIATACGVAVVAACPLSAQTLNYKTTWAGNTFGGASYTTVGGWPDHKHVQLNISDLCVDSDGTVYTDAVWDEGGAEAGIYKNGDQIGHCLEMSHGWGRQAGYAVTVDKDYIYADMTQNGDDGGDNGVRKNRNGLPVFPARGTQWYCIRRFHKNGTSAPFPTGFGDWGDMMILNTATATANRFPEASARGLVVHKGLIYVSDPFRSRISAYDLGEMNGQTVKSFAVSTPSKIVFDGSNRLWVLQSGSGGKLLSFDENGRRLPKEIRFKSTMVPWALAWNAAAGRLMVADQGRDQNIKLYDPDRLSPDRKADDSTTPTSTFGIVGGIHAGVDGKVGPLRFFDPIGVGADARGNIYVVNSIANGGGPGISMESYTPAGQQNWVLQCLEFVTCDDADPKSETEVYSSYKHYVMDYSRQDVSSWKFLGLTQDRFKYPDDPRIHRDFSGGVWVRRINGQKYLFVTQQMGHEICILRFNTATDGETAIPYAYITGRYQSQRKDGWPTGEPGSAANSTEWIWRDANGNGKIDAGEYAFPAAGSPQIYDAGWGLWVDQRGDIWQCGHGHIRHFKVQLDDLGRPTWDYASGHVELMNPPTLPSGAHWKHGVNGDNDDMDRLEYEPDTDTMYVSGFTTDYPDDTDGSWGDVGRVVYRYDHWSGARGIHPGYPIVLPWGDKGSLCTKSMTVEGSYLFVVEARDPEIVTVYDAETGKQVGIMSPGPEVGNRSGWVDANYGMRAYRRSNGEYLIFVEEDLYEKALIYRWTPPKE